jgi:SAM-dependent methyltransferase
MSREILENQLKAWNNKPVLRTLYRQWFNEIERNLTAGISVEIGCGISRLKEHIPDVVTVDVVKLSWIDAVCDAHELPFRSGSVGNLILFDVLHHLSMPMMFFSEASRVLKPGGRMIIIEPYVSPVSWLIFKFFHPEPIWMACNPLDSGMVKSSNRPFDSNQAIPTLIFFRFLKQWRERFPEFTVKTRKKFAFIAYPATGGFGGRQLLTDRLILLTLSMEKYLGFSAFFTAFRVLVVVEKDYAWHPE